MVTPRHPLAACAVALLAASLLCQCETVQTVKSTRSGGYTFDDRMWGGQGQSGNSEANAKFTQRGYSIAEDGSVVADKADLYRDQKLKGFNSEFKTKEARLGKSKVETKAFRTPEYLKRQEYAGVSSAREGGMKAREGNSTQSPFRNKGKAIDTKSKSSTDYAAYKTKAYRKGDSVFKTKADRDASAVTEAPRATGTPRQIGYQDNVALSMDDVKKMLNPNAYARGTGIVD